jgi:chromosome segregation ATPase
MSNEVPLVDLIAFGNLRMATIRALSIDEADKVIAAIECRDAEIARLRAECDDLAADVRRLQAWGEGLARENAELRQRLDDASCTEEAGDDELPEGSIARMLKALMEVRLSKADVDAVIVKFQADMEEVIERARKWVEEVGDDEPS